MDDSVLRSDTSISSDGILVCGKFATTVEGGATVHRNEWFSVVAMNNKLAHFPEFATAFGLKRVENCAEARALHDFYVEYSIDHPDFDIDEPVDWTPPPAPEMPTQRFDDDVEVPKIRGGAPDLLTPVVGIDGDLQCTATFIGRNWIMTAAHCLQTEPGFVPTDAAHEPAAKVHKWYRWSVTRYGQFGVPIGTAQTFDMLQFVDPRYLGFRDLNSRKRLDGARHDFALLYVGDWQDHLLPNNEPNPAVFAEPYMRISLRKTLAPSVNFWGRGNPDPDLKLFRGSIQGYSFADNTSLLFVGLSPSDPSICSGDSGGPLVDRYDLKNPFSNMVYTDAFAVGVASRSPGDPCTTLPGPTAWVRTSEERLFIQSTISQYYLHYKCLEGSTVGASTPDYLQCWAKPCKEDSDCTKAEICVHAASSLKNKTCTSCVLGGCDCMYGQCLPL